MSVQSIGLSKEERCASAFRPMTITVNTASALSGISAAKIWGLIKSGRLPVTRIDGRTLVPFPSVRGLGANAGCAGRAEKEDAHHSQGR
jgi:hypothetical protein